MSGARGIEELTDEVWVDVYRSKGLSGRGVIVDEGAVVFDDVVFRQVMQIQLQ